VPARRPEPVWPDAPRYGPDEPFPPYAYEPGGDLPHPIRDPDGHSHGAEEDDDPHGFERGLDLYHAGYLWEAHEAWEGVWKASADPAERAFLKALIQMTAMLLKKRQGKDRGVEKLAARALAHLENARDRYRGVNRDVVERMIARRTPGPLPVPPPST